MHILLIGDVVGNSGCCFLQERLPQLKRTHQVDLTIVNGENSAQGNGITKHSMEQLFSAGADIITTGNHCFQRREALSIYEKETILRPLNFPDSCPGHGCTIWDNGPYQVAVINLMGTAYMDPLDNPFTVIEEFLPTLPTKNIIVDFHAEATAEKKAKVLSGAPSGVHIRKCWNYSRRAKDRLSSARKRWAISVESRIFTASFTSLPCWKCRKKQKKKLLCRQQDKNRRKNKFFAHAGLDNHALGDII